MKLSQYISIAAFVLLIILSVLTVCFYFAWQTSETQSQQRYDNFNQSLNMLDQQIQLNNSAELAELYPAIDSLIKSMDIKHVTQVHQTNYHYSQDSIITVLVPIDPLPTDSIISQLPNDSIVWYKKQFSFSIDTACIHISGTALIPHDSNRVGQLIFDKIQLDDEISTIYFWQRKRLFNWKWTPRWGKKQYNAESHNKCNSKVETINISIKKQ